MALAAFAKLIYPKTEGGQPLFRYGATSVRANPNAKDLYNTAVVGALRDVGTCPWCYACNALAISEGDGAHERTGNPWKATVVSCNDCDNTIARVVAAEGRCAGAHYFNFAERRQQ